jgi:serine-type D-Ala-D-Ala endopeptidase (penicillin-binding protein 7)
MLTKILKLCAALTAATLLFNAMPAQAKGSTKKQTSSRYAASKKISKSKVSAKKAAHKSTRKSNKKQVKNSLKSHSKKSSKLVANSRKAIYVPQKLSMGELGGLSSTPDPLSLQSNVALVVDQQSSKVLFEKNADVPLPIASITKLMTSLVVLEAGQDMHEILDITPEDVDMEKNSGSRLGVGSQLTRADMLHIALMSSENRAASSLGRHYPGGKSAFVAAMNAKAKALGMTETHYVDSTGLSSHNVASAQDLAKLVTAAYAQPLIREYSTDTKYAVSPGGRTLQYISSNKLTSKPDWQIGLQKTGYISEAGRCLVMQAMIQGRAVVMVFLDSKGKYSRFADAGRIRNWLERNQLGRVDI